MSTSITLNVNGTDYPVTIDANRNLVSVLRTEIGLTGTKEGCDDCECGACMVLIDGRPVNSCSYLAVQAADRAITTVEGVMIGDDLHPLQQALLDEGGVQCGFCTPGMIMSATALLSRNASPTEEEIRIGLSGNLCRCTGYVKILAAVQSAAPPTPPTDPSRLLGREAGTGVRTACPRAVGVMSLRSRMHAQWVRVWRRTSG